MKVLKIAAFICLSLLMLGLLGFGLFKLISSRRYQIIGKLEYRGNTTEKVVALTFDDGPTEYTSEILDVLRQKNVKATFFLIGEQIEANKAFAKAIVDAGHELGNHSYTHQRMVFKSMRFYREEVEKTDALIREAGYTGKIYFRQPYGKRLLGLPYYLWRTERTIVTWDIEPNTFIDQTAPNEELIRYIRERVQPGSIILLHPWYGEKNNSRQALPELIDQLRQDGYEFRTVSEIL